MGHIAIWKYYDEEMRYYFNDSATANYHPTYVDRIKINGVIEFPTFSLKAEDRGGLLEYTAGDFRIRLSYLQTETSVNGDTIRDFLFPDIKPCKFLCQVYISDNFHYAGFFTSYDLTQALTFNKNDYYVDIKVKGALKEFADSYSQINQGTRVFTGDSFWSLEFYLTYHFDYHNTWGFDLPATNYRDRIGSTNASFNTKLQSLVNQYGANFNDVPRWETFQELRAGLGFDCKLYFEQPDQFITERPDFTLKIFWLTDIIDDDPVSISVLSHDTEYIINSKPNLFIPSRYSTITRALGSFDVFQGIVFNETDSISMSANDVDYEGSGNTPGFMIIRNGTEIEYRNRQAVAKQNRDILKTRLIPGIDKTWDYNSQIQHIDRKFYTYSQTIYDGTFAKGGMSYSFFIGEGVNQRHNKIQDYLFNIYKRFTGSKEVKIMDIYFDINDGIDLFRRITLSGKEYYISEINAINLPERTASIRAIEI